MKRPLIGLTLQAHAGVPELKRGRPIYYLCAQYADRVREAGGVPLLLVPGDMEPEVLDALDGLLLTGGEDIDPTHFDEAPHPMLGDVDARRDAQELPLAREAAARKLPVLGICRGAQVLNVALGGTLFQDLPSQHASKTPHVQDAPVERSTHSVRLSPESLLFRLAGSRELGVNTFHHQAVRELASGLEPTAWAPDGVLEGFEAEEGWLVGVQWHPELQPGPFTRALFRAFVEASAMPRQTAPLSR